MAATRGVEQLIRFPDGSKVISWLPSAHIAERMAHHYLPIVYAMTITTCPNPREVVGYLPAVKPTWFFAVPRIWEKLKAGMEGFLASGEGGEQKTAHARGGDAQGRARAGRRAGSRGPRRDRRAGRRAAVLPDPGDARLRPGRRRERRRGADAARGAGLLPRDRRAAGRAVGDVGDLRSGRLQPAREDQDRHGRTAHAGRRGQAGRGRRAADPLRRGHDGLQATCPTRPRRRSTPTAGCTRATSPRSTRTATSRSSTARRS